MVGPEARIDREQPVEAPEDQAGAEQQHHRQCDFSHHQDGRGPGHAPGDSPAGRPGETAHPGLHRRHQRRNHREQQRRGQRDRQRVAQHRGVDASLVQPRHRDARRDERDQRRHAPVRDRQAGRGGDQREQQVLGDQLREQAQSSRAKRDPQRHLVAPVHAANEQQVRDVGARDQQQHAHRPEQQLERPPRVADQRITQGDRRILRGLIRRGRLPFHLCDSVVEVGRPVGEGVCPASIGRSQTSMRPSGRRRRQRDNGRDDEIGSGIGREVEASRRDPDHLPILLVNPESAADHRGIPTKAALPQVVAEHRHRRCSRPALFRREEAAERRLHPQGRRIAQDPR